MSDISPESPLGQQLKGNICRKLNQMDLGDDANDIADFILVLISNNRTPQDIVSELTNLFGDVISEEFVQSIFSDIVSLRSGGNSQPTQQIPEQQQQQQQQQQQIPVQDAPQKQVEFSQQTIEHPSSVPSLPKSFVQRSNGGVGKFSGPGNNKRGNFAMKNELNFKRALGAMNGFQPGQPLANINQKPFTQRRPLGRCRQHPYCTNKDCKFSHPTKLCFAYPNCPNGPGTCNYLHPGDDDALFAQIANIKQLKLASREEVQQFYPQRQNRQQPEMTVCKFGAVCQKETCPFAHPTPANKNAQVTVMEWCPNGKECSDESCNKAHQSPNYKPTAEQQQQQLQKSLEQCKYGAHCTNYKCPRRHATSPVLCREGANCTRVDCFFSHPIDEDCRFGVNCMNVNCPYKHPEGRSTGNNKWIAGQQSTSERTFAVPEDQVMEQAPAQEAS